MKGTDVAWNDDDDSLVISFRYSLIGPAVSGPVPKWRDSQRSIFFSLSFRPSVRFTEGEIKNKIGRLKPANE